MIKIVNQKPINHFEKFGENDCIWFENWHEDEIYAYTALQINIPSAGIHHEVIEFSPAIWKALVNDFSYIKGFCKALGCKGILVTNPNLDDEVRWTKFISKLGFPEPIKILISNLEI